jgi:hypothetical protein
VVKREKQNAVILGKIRNKKEMCEFP